MLGLTYNFAISMFLLTIPFTYQSNSMKLKFDATWYLCLLLLLLNIGLQAQTLEPNYGSPASPLNVANGAATFKIRINGGTGACAPASALSITLPPGYVYIANSATVTAGSGTVSQTSATNNTATLSVSSIPAAPDSTVITYRAYPGCGVIGGSTTTISYSLTGCAGTVNASATVNAQNAQLNITNVTNSAFVGTLNQSYNREITVANNGFGIIDTIYIDSKSGLGLTVTNSSASTGTLSVTKTWTGTDTTYRYRIVAPTADGHLANGESVVITETVKIASCAGMVTNFKAWYGPNATECSAVSNTSTAGASLNTSTQPTVVLSTQQIPNLKCLPTGINDGWVVFKAKNTSAVPALISLVTNHGNSACHACFPTVSASGSIGGNTCGTRNMYIDTAAGVTISTNGGTTYNPLAYTVFQSWDTWTGYNAGKPIALTLMTNRLLNGGDSILIRLKIHDEIPTCCAASWYQASLSMGGTSRDACGNNPVSLSSTSVAANAAHRYSMNNSSAADAIGGSVFNLTYNGFILTASSSLRTDNTGYVDYVITLPTSLDPSTVPADHSITKGTTVIAPSSVTWDPLTRKLRIRFLRSVLTSADYSLWDLSIKTTVNCAGTGNSASLDAFVKLSDCATAEWQALCNREASFTVHGCNPLGCEGPLNYATVVKRTNFGIYAANNDGVPSGTINTANLRLDNTIYGDTVAVTTRAKIQGTLSFSNIFVGITKSEADAAHSFVDATAYVYNGGTLVNTVTGITMGNTSGTNPSTRVISLATGVGAPASYVAGDSIVVITRFKQLIDVDKRIDFTTTTYSSNSTTFGHASQIACDGNWTGTIYNYGTAVASNGDPTLSMTECSPVTGSYTMQFQINPSTSPAIVKHARFPYEIRKIFELDTLRMIVKPGFEITNMRIVVNGQVSPNATIASYPLLAFDAATNRYYYDLSTLEATILGAGNTFTEGFSMVITPTFRASCKTGNFGGADNINNVQVRNKRPNVNWNYNGGVFYLSSNNSTFTPLTISSPSPNLTVNSNTVSWTIQVSNATAIAKPNAWLAEAIAVNGTTINSVQELVANVPGAPLTVANGIYQLGSIPAGTTKLYRVNATFASCVADSTRLIVDYNCDAYPTSVASGASGCRVQNLPLTVTAQTAALQLAKIAEPIGSQNLCDNLVYELEVTNSGLGSATELAVRVQLPFTGGIQYVAGTYGYKFPSTAGSYTSLADANVTVSGSNMTFTIPASAIATLAGTEKYRIQFQMKTLPCNFSSGEKLVFRPAGKNACAANIFGTSVAGNRINIVGVPPLLPQFTITSSVDSVTACGAGAVSTNYKFKIVNTGSLVTSAADGFRITLPAPWTMNTAVTYSHNVTGAAYSTSPAANVYDFKTGTGLAIGDSIVFTTTLNAASATALVCGASNPIVETGFVEFATYCANPVMNCNTKQLLEPEHTSTSIFVKRPSYTITAFTASATGTPQNHLVGSVTVANGNTTYVTQDATLKVYHDVNQNGVQDAGDVLIGNQVFALTSQPSQSFSYDITATVAGNVCPLVAVMDIACNCSPASFSLVCNNVVLPIRFTKEEVRASGCTVDLAWAYEATGTIVTGFRIDRSKGGSNKWETMATVPAPIGTYTDNVPGGGSWLYRIQALNTDNEMAFSRILSVNTDCKATAVHIYPNPAREQVNIVLQGYGAADVNYTIMDKLGRNVQQGTVKGNSSNTIKLNNLTPGMYHVHLQYGGNNFVQKIDVLK